MTVAAISSIIRPMLEPNLPAELEVHWFSTKEEALEVAPLAEIGWFDMYEQQAMADTVRAATSLKWLNSVYAGLDFLPHDLLIERGITVTNGTGLNAVSIAEYVVMMLLNITKNYREFERAQARKEWLLAPPGTQELAGTRALILGYGAIGQQIAKRLAAFEVEITPVRRSAAEGALGPDEWRGRLGEFDWVILSVPSTVETDAMFGAAEFAAMKQSAYLVNIARGAVIDQPALVEALEKKAIGGAYLDVTTPEPLPPEHPLWEMDNVHITMHLSRGGVPEMMVRAAQRFLDNFERYRKGEPIGPVFDPRLGY